MIVVIIGLLAGVVMFLLSQPLIDMACASIPGTTAICDVVALPSVNMPFRLIISIAVFMAVTALENWSLALKKHKED